MCLYGLCIRVGVNSYTRHIFSTCKIYMWNESKREQERERESEKLLSSGSFIVINRFACRELVCIGNFQCAFCMILTMQISFRFNNYINIARIEYRCAHGLNKAYRRTVSLVFVVIVIINGTTPSSPLSTIQNRIVYYLMAKCWH